METVYYCVMTLTHGAEIPVYLKLRNLLSAAILDGKFPEGGQLPSVRAFAGEHGANPLTVAKAYQSLQDDNYVTVRRGVGMFVAEGAVARLRSDERERFLTESWPRIRAHMDRLDIEWHSLVGADPV